MQSLQFQNKRFSVNPFPIAYHSSSLPHIYSLKSRSHLFVAPVTSFCQNSHPLQDIERMQVILKTSSRLHNGVTRSRTLRIPALKLFLAVLSLPRLLDLPKYKYAKSIKMHFCICAQWRIQQIGMEEVPLLFVLNGCLIRQCGMNNLNNKKALNNKKLINACYLACAKQLHHTESSIVIEIFHPILRNVLFLTIKWSVRSQSYKCTYLTLLSTSVQTRGTSVGHGYVERPWVGRQIRASGRAPSTRLTNFRI